MSAHKFQCTNLANCDKALTKEVIEIEDGEEAICPDPDCGFKLTPVPVRPGAMLSWAAPVVAAIVLAAGWGGYFAWKKSLIKFPYSGTAASRTTTTTPVKPTPDAAPVSVSTPVLAPSPIPSPGSAVVTYPCNLSPAFPADTARVLQYLKQGMNYASQKKPDLALNEFGQVLKIDPNFLGANMNIGVANMALRKYSAAEPAFKDELHLVDCFGQMNDDQLAKFAYMEEVSAQATGRKEILQVQVFRDHLAKAEASIHYNLACLNAKRNQNGDAIAELRQAIKGGLIDKKVLQTDPDLEGVRNTREFKDLMAGYMRASATLP